VFTLVVLFAPGVHAATATQTTAAMVAIERRMSEVLRRRISFSP
jgi:hypothetical protein